MDSMSVARKRSTLSAALLAVAIAASVSGCGAASALPLRPTASESARDSTPPPTDAAGDAVPGLDAGAAALIIGDSFTEAFGATSSEAGWANLAARTLGWDAVIDGVGGTGFTKSIATDGRTGADFTSRIQALSARGLRIDVVVLQGGLNDTLASPTIEETNVSAAVRAAQLAWPDASVLVFGPTAPLASVAYRANVSAIRDAAIDAGAIYIDPDEPAPWINSGNTALLDFGDGLHLNDRGYAYLAARFAAAVEALRG